MSSPRVTTTETRPSVSGTVLVVAIVVAFVMTVAAAVVILVAVPEGANPGSMVTVLLGAFAALVPSLVALAKIGDVKRIVEELSNGKMDSKIRAGVADVIRDDHLDPAASVQLEADRARRTEGGGAHRAT